MSLTPLRRQFDVATATENLLMVLHKHSSLLLLFICLCRATNSKRLSSLLRILWRGLAGTSGRCCTVASVPPLSCCPNLLRMDRSAIASPGVIQDYFILWEGGGERERTTI